MSDGSAASTLLGRRLQPRRELRTAHLKVADRCNHACIHCYQIQGLKGELSTLDAKAAIASLAADGVFVLTISGGEATLRADLLDLIAEARRHNMAVALYTNGFVIDEAYARALASLAVWQVHVSVHGSSAPVHDRITRVPGSFARALGAVRLLRAEGVNVVMKMSVLDQNASDIEPLRNIARELGCSFAANEDMIVREDGDLTPLALGRGQYRTSPLAYETEAQHAAQGRRTCNIASSVAINADGQIFPCVSLDVPIGDVRAGAGAAHASEQADFLRSIHAASLHGCRDCDLLAGCRRCHATALAETGDMLGPYPTGCAKAVDAYRAHHPNAQLVARAGRPSELGPFRRETSEQLRQIADVVTEQDRAAYRHHSWLLRPNGATTNAPLVKLRVPRRSRTIASERD